MGTISEKHRLLVGLEKADSSKDDLLLIFLLQAENKVLKARCPYGYTATQKEVVLSAYSDNVENIYTYLYNKRGAEGESSHDENGISRAYESAGIPSSFFDGIVPLVDVI